MNDFLQQFVIESRELVGQAVEGLLALERSPLDAEGVDGVFRAFHTLKGGAGIVDFAAMERAVHAAEEVLGEVRSGQRAITPLLVNGCLASLDQVSRWLDAIAQSGALPHADREADTVLQRFAELASADTVAARPAPGADDWVQSLWARHGHPRQAVMAVRYIPSDDCFFQGEDPAARMAGLPQLLAQELVPRSAWPSLSELDPYACNLVLLALSGASAESVRGHLTGYVGDCEVVDLKQLTRPSTPGDLAGERLRELIQAQRALLAEDTSGRFAGCIASAGHVAANALLSVSRDDERRAVLAAMERSLSDNTPAHLDEVLRGLLAAAPEPSSGQAAMPASRLSETTIRIDTARVDALVRLTGELTTAKNALAHTTARAQDNAASAVGALRERLQEFERLIARLQHSVLALRVLPLRTVMQRLPRVLREISSALGKPVALQIEGEHTEADKAIVDILFEPLLHALRNAVDHGVESPARRVELRKPLVATIRIRARQAVDRVIIEVEDDGSGVDVARVRELALQRQIVSAETLQEMDEADIANLVFAPGFSTAATVSEISGRGVGLDAVRAALRRVGGQVTLTSRPGLGTTLTFSLPFSVMVTQVLTVESGGQMFGVPLDALLETIRVPRHRISGVGAAQVIVHRERTLPLLELAGELGHRGGVVDSELSDVTVVLARVSEQIIALRVDRVGERIEVILKPLEGLLAGIKNITGTTLLGTGQVLLVLDLGELLT